jgi:hypothetical protein
MPSNYSALPQATLDMVAHSIRTTELAAADLICSKASGKTTLAGSFPVRTKLLARGENGGLGRGAEAKSHDQAAESVIYECLAYVGEVEFFEEDEIDWDAFGESEMTEAGKAAYADCNLAVDLKLQSVLTSTSLNTEFDVTSDGNGAWSDGGTASTPLDDLYNVLVQFPGLDTLVFGAETERYLASHPDLIAEVSNFNGGQLDFSAVVGVLARKLGLDPSKVHSLRNRFYNTAADGAPEVIGNLMGSGLWFGTSANLHMIDPKHARNGEFRFIPEERKRMTVAQMKRYIDIKRSGGVNRGVAFTGIK